ncbi:PTS glucose transporter subunit IIA [Virgibacillus dakarensis]|uniref:PTS glucose transporter subunit IIA n=1 Tax=Lentibacillus populi TaxID=1827502 RepID=A0A9W5U0C7_9BACI|nr:MULTISPECIES: PTS glucose transporter subunit IIA [Bacillaceae]MBT2216086.1 PTS glucose transporter subunit IIA [Virgibacillus dakarensis]MTW87652.1 PTS glucose transporter subunit IIA [Virgibacillus dakarensis]GGB55215.1 PTS glucose transporter subunit IIA [Lentibacillus populi]
MFKNLFKKSSTQQIYAPMNGTIVPLEEVPDPVFSQKMMGEGVAMIPSEGKVLSPVDGKVVQVPDSKHAVGIEANDGTELLIHIGLETVALKGEGFTPKVNVGDPVSVGDLLMEFDLDYIRNHAKDVITPIVITNSQNSDKQYVITEQKEGRAAETEIITVS